MRFCKQVYSDSNFFTMPKRKCVFNENLQRKYPFIKQGNNTPSDIRCEKCGTAFSVSHVGASDIKQHLLSDKHRRSEHASSSSTLMVDYFKKSDAPNSNDMDIAVARVFGPITLYTKITVFAATIVPQT